MPPVPLADPPPPPSVSTGQPEAPSVGSRRTAAAAAAAASLRRQGRRRRRGQHVRRQVRGPDEAQAVPLGAAAKTSPAGAAPTALAARPQVWMLLSSPPAPRYERGVRHGRYPGCGVWLWLLDVTRLRMRLYLQIIHIIMKYIGLVSV